MPRSKTYDPSRVPKGRRNAPDGHDDGAGGPVRPATDTDAEVSIPYWYIEDEQGDEPEPGDG